MKPALALVLLASLSSAAPVGRAAPYSAHADASFPILCGESRGGTGFRIGPNRIVTAAHVTAGGPCRYSGGELALVREDGEGDIAELHSPVPGPFLRFQCRGFRDGRIYLGVGFVNYRGRIYRQSLPLLATLIRTGEGRPQTVFVGELEHGMSGGPIIDRDGVVAGINNRRSPASSRSLSDSFICQRG